MCVRTRVCESEIEKWKAKLTALAGSDDHRYRTLSLIFENSPAGTPAWWVLQVHSETEGWFQEVRNKHRVCPACTLAVLLHSYFSSA